MHASLEINKGEARYTSTRAYDCEYSYIGTHTTACRSKNGGDCQIDILNGFNGAGIIRMLAPSPRESRIVEQI